MKIKLIKLFRFASIYGLSRAFNKSFGRMRLKFIKSIYFNPFVDKSVSIIGCGQFSFTTIAYFIGKNKGRIFLGCHDIDPQQATSISKFYSFQSIHQNVDTLLNEQGLKIVYIASNHNSHTEYAVKAINANKIVYIEKPLSTTFQQFVDLISVKRLKNANIFVGYNRPYSSAIVKLREFASNNNGINKSFSINYFISGHLIEKNHWYRKPEEGTRVCGNLGHWIDLTIHLFNLREKLPQFINITVTFSNLEESDDNFCVTLSTDLNDIVNMMITSRTEPFEGINETINFQYGDTIAKIDDFRQLTIWHKHKLKKFNFFPKDVGHQRAVMQPFEANNRDWFEVEISTLLMLKVKDMVIQRKNHDIFVVDEQYNFFNHTVEGIINETNNTKP